MPAIVFPRSGTALPNAPRSVLIATTSVLGVWFLLVASLGAAGVFVGLPGAPPVAIALGVSMPLILFFAFLRLSQSFREFVLSIDLRLVVGIQAWRWAGMGFLSLYAHKILPAVFAFPAGLGDMAVGATAPWMVLSLLRRPEFAASAAFVRWNLLGILDLAVAVSIGAVGAFAATGAPGEISTAPLAKLPLLIIPAYLVPLFLMLHVTALLQGRGRAASHA